MRSRRCDTTVIETERLILRPFMKRDAADVLEYLRKPPRHCFCLFRLRSIWDARREMKRRAHNTEYYFAVVLKEKNKVIGEMEAFRNYKMDDETNLQVCLFTICWMLNEPFRGKGYAYEAAHAFFDYLFHEKGAERIHIETEDINYPCQRLCERLGMRKTGMIMGKRSFNNNPDGSPHYDNIIQYDISMSEWNKKFTE